MITVDFNRLNIKAGYRILDIGCGSGRHTCAAYR
ncbi:MAG: SAM-dependent methyltransferase, partial [Desulfobacterales bacterium]|nr:SAM-dependent methyltransferase [Desulfobacterales bacterium]